MILFGKGESHTTKSERQNVVLIEIDYYIPDLI